MPGMLSSIFDPAADNAHAAQSESHFVAEAEQDLSIDQDIAIAAGVTYHDPDGGTHSFQSDNAVGLEADVGASLGAALGSAATSQDGAI